MKTIGVLGGMGPQATMDFEARVHAVSQQLIPQHFNSGYPRMIVYYHRGAPMITREHGSPDSPFQIHPDLAAALPDIGRIADFLVITANSGHLIRDAIEQ